MTPRAFSTMMQGMGDDVEWSGSDDGVVLEQRLQVIRGLGEAEAGLVLIVERGLAGHASSQRQLKQLEVRVWVTCALALSRRL